MAISDAPPPLGPLAAGPSAPLLGKRPRAAEESGRAEVRLSEEDKAAQMQIGEDGRLVTSWKGYRTVRATHGAAAGAHFFEVTLRHLGETGHARVGWATRKAELHAPVGADAHGFCIRDVNGATVHAARRTRYLDDGPSGRLVEGDVIGCYIYVPEPPAPTPGSASDKEKESDGGNAAAAGATKDLGTMVKVKGVVYFDPDHGAADGAADDGLPGAVAFTVNGKCPGVAYRNVRPGVAWFPAVSLYTANAQQEGATAAVNFGPAFAYPPTADSLPADCPPPSPASALAAAAALRVPP